METIDELSEEDTPLSLRKNVKKKKKIKPKAEEAVRTERPIRATRIKPKKKKNSKQTLKVVKTEKAVKLVEPAKPPKKRIRKYKPRVRPATKNFSCKECGYKFYYPSNLENHMLVHTGARPHECEVCGKRFNSRYTLKGHMYIHTNEKPFTCSFCSYACRDSSTLRKHQYRHMGVKEQFACQSCERSFSKKSILKEHVAEVHLQVDIRVHRCDTCGGRFKTAKTLSRHVRVVHERVNKTTCPICNITISDKANLKAHLRTHTEPRPYLCKFPGCTNRYRSVDNLTKHAIIHYPDKQFPCDICGYLFTRRHRLRYHILKVHERSRCVECDYCGQKFYSKNYLIVHIRKKHAPRRKKYICDLCGFKTHNKPSIVGHIKFGHGSENDLECKICKKFYKRNVYLKMHYKKTHGQTYKRVRFPKKPSTGRPGRRRIKSEPPDDQTDAEPIDLLDIIKQETLDIDEPELEPNEPLEQDNEPREKRNEPHKKPNEPRKNPFELRVMIERIGLQSVPEKAFEKFCLSHVLYTPLEEEREKAKYHNQPSKKLQEIGTMDVKVKKQAEKSLDKLLGQVRQRTAAEKLERARQIYNERMTNIYSKILQSKTKKSKQDSENNNAEKEKLAQNRTDTNAQQDTNAEGNDDDPSSDYEYDEAVSSETDYSLDDDEESTGDETSLKNNKKLIRNKKSYNKRSIDSCKKTTQVEERRNDEEVSTENNVVDELSSSEIEIDIPLEIPNTETVTRNRQLVNSNVVENNDKLVEKVNDELGKKDKGNQSSQKDSKHKTEENSYKDNIKDPTVEHLSLLLKDVDNDITKCDDVHEKTLNNINLMHAYARDPVELEAEIKSDVESDQKNTSDNKGTNAKNRSKQKLECKDVYVTVDVPEHADVPKKRKRVKKVVLPVNKVNENIIYRYVRKERERKQKLQVRELNDSDDDLLSEIRKDADSNVLQTKHGKENSKDGQNEVIGSLNGTPESIKVDNVPNDVSLIETIAKEILNSVKELVVVKDNEIINKETLPNNEGNKTDNAVTTKRKRKVNRKYIDDNFIVEDIMLVDNSKNNEKTDLDDILQNEESGEINDLTHKVTNYSNKAAENLHDESLDQNVKTTNKDTDNIESPKRKRKVNKKYIDDNFIVEETIVKKDVNISSKSKEKVAKKDPNPTTLKGKRKRKFKNYKEEEDESKEVKRRPGKMNFNSHQCYVCFKLFSTKEDLVGHCQEHFDICNETLLKKCPLCNYVGKSGFTRHMRLAHEIKIKIPYGQLRDSKENPDGSRYYFEIENKLVKKVEVIPSVKNLNKIASLKIDKKKREMENKTLSKRKLVRKGKEWIVEKEKINFSEDVILPEINSETFAKISDKNSKISDSDPYFESLKKLYHVAKKEGKKILFPCQHCDKICQNFSALKLHNRKHETNPKPFAPKVWKHKLKDPKYCQKVIPKEEKVRITVSHRTAKPQPIKNKHKCDPKLREFYEKNIRGGDIEFWQFLKIFNKMSRENINDFGDLDGNYEYGMAHHEKQGANNTIPEEGEITSQNTNEVYLAQSLEMEENEKVDDDITDVEDDTDHANLEEYPIEFLEADFDELEKSKEKRVRVKTSKGKTKHQSIKSINKKTKRTKTNKNGEQNTDIQNEEIDQKKSSTYENPQEIAKSDNQNNNLAKNTSATESRHRNTMDMDTYSSLSEYLDFNRDTIKERKATKKAQHNENESAYITEKASDQDTSDDSAEFLEIDQYEPNTQVDKVTESPTRNEKSMDKFMIHNNSVNQEGTENVTIEMNAQIPQNLDNEKTGDVKNIKRKRKTKHTEKDLSISDQDKKEDIPRKPAQEIINELVKETTSKPDAPVFKSLNLPTSTHKSNKPKTSGKLIKKKHRTKHFKDTGLGREFYVKRQLEIQKLRDGWVKMCNSYNKMVDAEYVDQTD